MRLGNPLGDLEWEGIGENRKSALGFESMGIGGVFCYLKMGQKLCDVPQLPSLHTTAPVHS